MLIAHEPNDLGAGGCLPPLFLFFKQIEFPFLGYKFSSWSSERSNSNNLISDHGGNMRVYFNLVLKVILQMTICLYMFGLQRMRLGDYFEPLPFGYTTVLRVQGAIFPAGPTSHQRSSVTPSSGWCSGGSPGRPTAAHDTHTWHFRWSPWGGWAVRPGNHRLFSLQR